MIIMVIETRTTTRYLVEQLLDGRRWMLSGAWENEEDAAAAAVAMEERAATLGPAGVRARVLIEDTFVSVYTL
jgi:hypothetical protein